MRPNDFHFVLNFCVQIFNLARQNIRSITMYLSVCLLFWFSPLLVYANEPLMLTPARARQPIYLADQKGLSIVDENGRFNLVFPGQVGWLDGWQLYPLDLYGTDSSGTYPAVAVIDGKVIVFNRRSTLDSPSSYIRLENIVDPLQLGRSRAEIDPLCVLDTRSCRRRVSVTFDTKDTGSKQFFFIFFSTETFLYLPNQEVRTAHTASVVITTNAKGELIPASPTVLLDDSYHSEPELRTGFVQTPNTGSDRTWDFLYLPSPRGLQQRLAYLGLVAPQGQGATSTDATETVPAGHFELLREVTHIQLMMNTAAPLVATSGISLRFNPNRSVFEDPRGFFRGLFSERYPANQIGSIDPAPEVYGVQEYSGVDAYRAIEGVMKVGTGSGNFVLPGLFAFSDHGSGRRSFAIYEFKPPTNDPAFIRSILVVSSAGHLFLHIPESHTTIPLKFNLPLDKVDPVVSQLQFATVQNPEGRLAVVLNYVTESVPGSNRFNLNVITVPSVSVNDTKIQNTFSFEVRGFLPDFLSRFVRGNEGREFQFSFGNLTEADGRLPGGVDLFRTMYATSGTAVPAFEKREKILTFVNHNETAGDSSLELITDPSAGANHSHSTLAGGIHLVTPRTRVPLATGTPVPLPQRLATSIGGTSTLQYTSPSTGEQVIFSSKAFFLEGPNKRDNTVVVLTSLTEGSTTTYHLGKWSLDDLAVDSVMEAVFVYKVPPNDNVTPSADSERVVLLVLKTKDQLLVYKIFSDRGRREFDPSRRAELLPPKAHLYRTDVSGLNGKRIVDFLGKNPATGDVSLLVPNLVHSDQIRTVLLTGMGEGIPSNAITTGPIGIALEPYDPAFQVRHPWGVSVGKILTQIQPSSNPFLRALLADTSDRAERVLNETDGNHFLFVSVPGDMRAAFLNDILRRIAIDVSNFKPNSLIYVVPKLQSQEAFLSALRSLPREQHITLVIGENYKFLTGKMFQHDPRSMKTDLAHLLTFGSDSGSSPAVASKQLLGPVELVHTFLSNDSPRRSSITVVVVDTPSGNAGVVEALGRGSRNNGSDIDSIYAEQISPSVFAELIQKTLREYLLINSNVKFVSPDGAVENIDQGRFSSKFLTYLMDIANHVLHLNLDAANPDSPNFRRVANYLKILMERLDALSEQSEQIIDSDFFLTVLTHAFPTAVSLTVNQLSSTHFLTRLMNLTEGGSPNGIRRFHNTLVGQGFLGGYDQTELLVRLFLEPMQSEHRTDIAQTGIRPLIFLGPPGTGKTVSIEAFLRELGLNVEFGPDEARYKEIVMGLDGAKTLPKGFHVGPLVLKICLAEIETRKGERTNFPEIARKIIEAWHRGLPHGVGVIFVDEVAVKVKFPDLLRVLLDDGRYSRVVMIGLGNPLDAVDSKKSAQAALEEIWRRELEAELPALTSRVNKRGRVVYWPTFAPTTFLTEAAARAYANLMHRLSAGSGFVFISPRVLIELAAWLIRINANDGRVVVGGIEAAIKAAIIRGSNHGKGPQLLMLNHLLDNSPVDKLDSAFFTRDIPRTLSNTDYTHLNGKEITVLREVTSVVVEAFRSKLYMAIQKTGFHQWYNTALSSGLSPTLQALTQHLNQFPIIPASELMRIPQSNLFVSNKIGQTTTSPSNESRFPLDSSEVELKMNEAKLAALSNFRTDIKRILVEYFSKEDGVSIFSPNTLERLSKIQNLERLAGEINGLVFSFWKHKAFANDNVSGMAELAQMAFIVLEQELLLIVDWIGLTRSLLNYIGNTDLVHAPQNAAGILDLLGSPTTLPGRGAGFEQLLKQISEQVVKTTAFGSAHLGVPKPINNAVCHDLLTGGGESS
ncbi:MAG: AAA family ATPase [Bdellovibrionales bacterium]|nr:AAA family ATPase [Bdellovibrionales bacterium]